MTQKLTVGFIGLGLIGGSIAKAIRHFYPDAYLMAHTRSEETMRFAKEQGIIDEALPVVDESYRKCDYIFLCAPVESNAAYLETLKALIAENCILTDVGSTKTDIHQKVNALGMQKNFIGGHPMTGSEKTGFGNAKWYLLENAYYILTPSEEVSKDMVMRYEIFVRSLKALPLILGYQEHDYVTAAISHLPHIIASSLVNLVKDSDSEREIMKQVAAGGFKDITRIASSSPEMWEQICFTNRENLVAVLNEYINDLISIRIGLEEQDQEKLHMLFTTSRDYRNSISDSLTGPIPRSFAIYCDMVDEAGGIAALATILATNGISIKNIGIVHNREFEEAVLHVEFYEASAKEKAVGLLRKYRYTVYER